MYRGDLRRANRLCTPVPYFRTDFGPWSRGRWPLKVVPPRPVGERALNLRRGLTRRPLDDGPHFRTETVG